MAQDIVNNDLLVNGAIYASRYVFPTGAVTNAAIVAAAAIDATKSQQQYQPCFGQNGTAVAERKVIHLVQGATATIVSFKCGVRVACSGNATITVDLLKNGVSVLSAAEVLDLNDAAFAITTPVVSTTGGVVTNVYEVNVTVNAGTGTLGQGLFAQMTIREDPS